MAKKKATRKKTRKKATTRAGKYVKEEMHARKKKKGKMSKKQAVAIGLSKARQKGIKVPKKKKASKKKSSKK
ncbi:DUF6496 domain-containing protein [Peredibacter starrii]|uniref:DUF6496 domain-containing protein n=1 Tax=Peredibacter starrii TaxID=28202 RepID=A0AAX4HTJ2_9BACT|nr:DUF6496 domain-containing protein [Peredibacter starrii]WPU66718.1 DUF6496 domain-containing protein [Peredibacter starrii]